MFIFTVVVLLSQNLASVGGTTAAAKCARGDGAAADGFGDSPQNESKFTTKSESLKRQTI